MQLEQGTELEELTVTPDTYLTVRYAGASGDYNPIHIDEEFAKAVGLPGRILHGLYGMALVARAAAEAGGGPAALASLEVQFRGMGFPEQELTVSGTVAEVGEETTTLHLEARQGDTTIIREGVAELRR